MEIEIDQAGENMWGGDGGLSWDDGIYHGVRQISVVYDQCIHSIHVVYDQNGKSVPATKHGDVGGSRTAEIKLQYPAEFLTSVSGHYGLFHIGSPVIRSLTFKSNRRSFGPYGVQEGKPFSFSTDGARIVGFKGRSGSYLNAVGFHLSKEGGSDQTGKIMWGGDDGIGWDDGIYHGVRQISVDYGDYIYSIQVVYDQNGKPVEGDKHGGDGSTDLWNEKITVKLEPDEFLKRVSGHYCWGMMIADGDVIIRSLTFESSKRIFGPYGEETGIPFSGPEGGARILGFMGRSNKRHLNAIGVHFLEGSVYEKINKRLGFEGRSDTHLKGIEAIGFRSSEVSVGVGKGAEENMFGGSEGEYWDNGSYDCVRKISVVHGGCIYSIRVVYDEKGAPVEKERHGGERISGITTESTVELNYPREFLKRVSGHYGPDDEGNYLVIRSLTFESNIRKFGPYGVEVGVPFSSPEGRGPILGFKGRSRKHLNAIGFNFWGVRRFKPVSNNIDSPHRKNSEY